MFLTLKSTTKLPFSNTQYSTSASTVYGLLRRRRNSGEPEAEAHEADDMEVEDMDGMDSTPNSMAPASYTNAAQF